VWWGMGEGTAGGGRGELAGAGEKKGVSQGRGVVLGKCGVQNPYIYNTGGEVPVH
tara:strand:+ start:676 stop:840 length:165 start_codon:yes stop_codon:yes gene_type:complete